MTFAEVIAAARNPYDMLQRRNGSPIVQRCDVPDALRHGVIDLVGILADDWIYHQVVAHYAADGTLTVKENSNV